MSGPGVDRIEVLGSCRVLAGAREVALGGRQQKRLLVALLVRPGVVAKEQLHDWLGDGVVGEDADRALRMRVSRLRAALGGGDAGPTVRWDGHGYQFVAGAATVDVDELRTVAATAVDDDPVTERDRMAAARGLLRGEPFADVAGEAWAVPAVTSVAAVRREVDERWAAAVLAAGDASAAAVALRALVDDEPFRERRWELLMLALYRAGRQRDALLAYQEMVERFDHDLGLRPGPRLRALEAAILAHDPTISGGEVSPRPSLAAGRLPTYDTPLVGRTPDLAGVADALATSRIVTITGPGGVGKTRLAVAAASVQRPRFWDGAWFVDLSAARPGDDLAALVQQELVGHRREGDHEPGEALPSVLAALEGKVACVVLDNAEQVVDEVRELARALTAAPGSVRLLITSRTIVGVPGERVVPIGPLDVAAGAELLRTRACARGAASGLLDDEAVAALCRRLDGLPLALELAAGWLHVLPPEALVARLDADASLLEDRAHDRSARHRTLEACMAWSHSLLDDAARDLFEAAGLFAGTWAPADVAVVTGVPERAALDAIARLVDASLVRPAPGGRFVLLPVLAAFARARGDRTGEGGARRRRLADHLIARVNELEVALRGAGFDAAVADLDAYEPTVQVVLDRLLAEGDAERFVAIVGAQGDFWYASGRRRRAVERCAQALALPSTPTVARARMLTHAAAVRSAADLVVNRPMLEEAVAILGSIGEVEAQTWAALFLVVSHDASGDTATGARWLDHASACAGGARWNRAVVDVFAATHDAFCGRPEESLTKMERAYRAFLDLGDRSWQARSQWVMATYLRAAGDATLAREALQRAIAHAEAAGDRVTAEHARLGLVRLESDPAVSVPALRWLIDRFAELGDSTCEASARRELARLITRAS